RSSTAASCSTRGGSPEAAAMADEASPTVVAAMAVQIALLLVGCVVLWRIQLRPRAPRPRRLPRWEISGFEFAFASFLVLAGAFTGQLLLAMLPVADPDNQLVAQSAGFQGGLLIGVLAAARALKRTAGPKPALNDKKTSGLPFL